MTIIGFNFSKLFIEKKKQIKGKININNNVSIKDVDIQEISIGEDKKTLNFTFEFTTQYSPDIGSIELMGNLLYLADEKEAKKVADEWKKTKKMDGQLMKQVLDHVLEKSNIQAIILSKEIGLPSPIPLPKINKKT